jgi:hypothetical protein
MRRRRNRPPRLAEHRKGVASRIGWRRDLVGVVSRIVPVRMVGVSFVGPTVFVAVAFVDLGGRQGDMALDFSKGKRSRIVGCGGSRRGHQARQHHRAGERKAQKLAVGGPTGHELRLFCRVPNKRFPPRHRTLARQPSGAESSARGRLTKHPRSAGAAGPCHRRGALAASRNDEPRRTRARGQCECSAPAGRPWGAASPCSALIWIRSHDSAGRCCCASTRSFSASIAASRTGTSASTTMSASACNR